MSVVRARMAPVAAALLVSHLSLTLPHVADPHHDPDGAFLHDPYAHNLAADAPDDGSTPPHCVVCHFARTFRLRTESHALPAPTTASGAYLHLDVVAVPRPATVAQPPLRSPPSSPVHLIAEESGSR